MMTAKISKTEETFNDALRAYDLNNYVGRIRRLNNWDTLN